MKHLMDLAAFKIITLNLRQVINNISTPVDNYILQQKQAVKRYFRYIQACLRCRRVAEPFTFFKANQLRRQYADIQYKY